jgi:hypothetical protein
MSGAGTGSANGVAPVEPVVRRTMLGRFSAAAKIAIAVLLALTPITAILMLGWMVRLMRRETAIAIVQTEHGIGRNAALQRLASAGHRDLVRFPGWWRGLWDTVKTGAATLVVVAIATLPFGALMLIGWWAGWENSFNKGYEQAWVGRALAFAGIAVAIFVLSHWPMMLSHYAAERRIGAIAELGVVRRLIGRVRWRYLGLSVMSVLAAAPIFLAQILPTFIEKIHPALISADPAQIASFAGRWHLAATVYSVLALIVLRRRAARLYARAILLEQPANAHFARDVARTTNVPPSASPGKRVRRISAAVAGMLTAGAWLAFIAALYIAQFANHAWWNWVNHPLVGLPWVFRPF